MGSTAAAGSSASTEPLRVAVTGAAGQIAYSLLANLVNGTVFGPTQPIILHLLDIEVALDAVQGVIMELEDCSMPLLRNAISTHLPEIAFKDADYAIMLGSMPRKQGMARSDLLKANVDIFKLQGKVIDMVAKKTAKILVVGNPANTNALVCQHYAPSIPAQQFSALTRLDQNRATALVAKKLAVPSDSVRRVIIWGNHSNTQFPDIANAEIVVDKKTGATKPAPSVVTDTAYFEGEFVQKVSLRGGEIIAARKLSSAMSAAKAICDHLRDWHFGTNPGIFVSMAVSSDGSYGVPRGLVFSFPVEISKETGAWKIVQNLGISEFAKTKLDATIKELEDERKDAFAFVA